MDSLLLVLAITGAVFNDDNASYASAAWPILRSTRDDPQGAVSGAAGADRSQVRTDTGAEALLSGSGWPGMLPEGTGANAAHLLRTPLLHPVRSGMDGTSNDSRMMQNFTGIDPGQEPAHDESTILKFRHLLELKHTGAWLLRLTSTYQGALPGPGEECHSPACGAGAGQSGDGEAVIEGFTLTEHQCRWPVHIQACVASGRSIPPAITP